MTRIIHYEFDSESPFSAERGIHVVRGGGRGNRETGIQPSFEDKVRELEAKITAGTMETRDWKCRYDYHFIVENALDDAATPILEVAIGPTSWQEWREDYTQSEEEARTLQELGRLQYNERGFYFSSGLGANVLTLTKEGQVVVGVRKSDSYDGAVHGAAGWMTFRQDVSHINPREDAYRELQEELGVQRDEVAVLGLIGLVAHPKTLEADFVFVAKTSKEGEYFTSDAWKEAVDAREHKELIVLPDAIAIEELLQPAPNVSRARYEVLPSTAYGLEILAQHWERFRR